jgi:hypothetical protein
VSPVRYELSSYIPETGVLQHGDGFQLLASISDEYCFLLVCTKF